MDSRANVNRILEKNGFKSGVDIKSGITGTIAHFKYNGDDEEIKQLAALSNGYVLVKIKSSEDSSMGADKDVILHANQTYMNECDVSKGLVGKDAGNTRPALLVKNMEGIDFILVQPLYNNKSHFYDQMQQMEVRQESANAEIAVSQARKEGLEKNNIELTAQAALLTNESKKLQTELSQMRRDLKILTTPANKNNPNLLALEKKHADTKAGIAGIEKSKKENTAEIGDITDDIRAKKENIEESQRAIIRSSFMNLQQHMEELGMRKSHNLDSIDKIFSGMQQTQARLHKDGYLHLDTAARNFVVTGNSDVHLIDLGASQSCNNEGKSPNRQFPIDPIYSYNQAALQVSGRDVSIQTDIFSLKVAMIESLAYFSGISSKEEIKMLHMNGLPGGENTQQSDLTILRTVDDQTRLQNLTKNLEKHANDLVDQKDSRGQLVLDAVKKYRAYLTSAPTPNLDREQTIQQNQRALLECSKPPLSPEQLQERSRRDREKEMYANQSKQQTKAVEPSTPSLARDSNETKDEEAPAVDQRNNMMP